MRRLLPMLLMTFIFTLSAAALNAFADVPWNKGSFDDILAKAAKENRHIFIDFYAVWCGPCKMLDKTTYKDEKVIKFLNAMVAVKYDGEKGEGEVLADKFKVKAYPALILLDPKGEEIGRYLGYLDAENFLKTMQDYMKGIGTISYYEKQLKEKSQDIPTLFKLGHKYADLYNEEQAEKHLEKIVSLDPKNKKGYSDQAYYYLGNLFYGNNKYESSAENFQKLIDKYPESENYNYALRMLARVYDKMGKQEKCMATFRLLIAKNPDDPKSLNAFAWFCASHKTGVDEAIPAAKRAVELTNGDPGMMDTLAELYYAKGDYQKAIEIEEEASQKDPQDTYLKDQIIKYLKAALKEVEKSRP